MLFRVFYAKWVTLENNSCKSKRRNHFCQSGDSDKSNQWCLKSFLSLPSRQSRNCTNFSVLRWRKVSVTESTHVYGTYSKKVKAGFVNGSIGQPDVNDVEYEAWQDAIIWWFLRFWILQTKSVLVWFAWIQQKRFSSIWKKDFSKEMVLIFSC